MKTFRSLVLKQIGLRLPDLTVLRLRVHRHLGEVDSVETHSHSFGQILCYLSTGGTLILKEARHEVRSGTVAWIPAGCRHGFLEHPVRRPVCMAIDLRLSKSRSPEVSCLNRLEAAGIRRELSRIGRLSDPASMESRFLAASSTLAILDIAFRALGFLPRQPLPTPGVVRTLETLITDPDLFGLGIGEVCQRAGGNPDHLNRVFKRHTGMTLQRRRNEVRVELCKRELLKGGPVGSAAEACGFMDANYFSRWFRQQTGHSPVAYRNSSIRKPSAK